MLQYSALPDKERSKLNMTNDMWTDPSIFYKTVGQRKFQRRLRIAQQNENQKPSTTGSFVT